MAGERSEPGVTERRAERRIGTTVGKYRIERILGVGGMACVYLAVHRNGHKVAIKMLHAEVSVDADLRARFVREGYAANAIDHRGVVRILDDDETEDGSAFLVMELLDGETLAARTKRAGRLPVREALALGHQLLDVVAAAHAKGVVHRDIKPENLFVTPDGVLKVLDFGIARMRAVTSSDSEPTHTGRAMGTPAFMAPEQAFGRAREVDERTDVFSCGATLFSVLSGELVHEAETAQEQMVYAATRPARSLGSAAGGGLELPREVVAVVDKALAFERAGRWQTAIAMRDALARVSAELFGEALTPAASGKTGTTQVSRSTLESAPTLDARAPPPPPSEHGAPASTPASITVPHSRPGRRLAAAVLVGAALSAVAWFSWKREAPAPALAPSVTAAAPTCTNASCNAGGARAVCRRGACVPLESEDCKVLARPEDIASDDTLWIGAMFPTRGPMAPPFVESIRAVDLARRDFLEVGNGLPSAKPGAPARPIAVVQCDDSVDPTRPARHLVEDLGVPAVVGFARSKEVVDLSLAFFNPRGVLALAANTAPMLSSIPTPPGQARLVWRVTYSGPMLTAAMAPLVGAIERELRASHVLHPGEPMRVLLDRVANTTGIGVSDAIVSSLRINGKTVPENGEGVFREVIVPDLVDVDGDTGTSPVVAAITAFRPHVVLDTAAGPELVGRAEEAWPRGERFRPRYVMQGALHDRAYAEAVAHEPSLARRLFGVDTSVDTPAVAKFVMRHNEVFEEKVNALDADDAPYDAVYTFAYLVAALGDAPVDGPSLARSIPRLAGGAPIDVGPAGIYAAVAALGRGENIDLRGTTTSLDFDQSTGDAPTRFAAFCFHADAAGKLAPGESGFFFDGRSGASGELRCP
jgi:serine/threonine-protein kinase